jgi:hypothetical protein
LVFVVLVSIKTRIFSILLVSGSGNLTGQNKAGCPIAVWVGIVRSLPEIIQALFTLSQASARAAFDGTCRGGLCACGARAAASLQR